MLKLQGRSKPSRLQSVGAIEAFPAVRRITSMAFMHRASSGAARTCATLLVAVICGNATTADAEVAPAADIYARNCAACHGRELQGSGLGPPLSSATYRYGGQRGDLIRIISNGIPSQQMPAFAGKLPPEQIAALADFLPAREGTEPESAPRDFSRRKDGRSAASLDYAIRVEVLADGLQTPWAIAFLDSQTALLTERTGRLRLLKNGVLAEAPVAGTPEVFVHAHQWNQGGLLDIAINEDYPQTGWVYLSYSHPLPHTAAGAETRAMTRVVRGRIREHRWVDQETLFEADPGAYAETYWHYGGRMAIDPEGRLHFSVGDRGAHEQAREPGRPNGKIHRIMTDGRIPQDNPFRGRSDALASIYSYGHRNPQGLTLEPATGRLWATEHGPRGGDELNLIARGADYGWPVISHGINYDGTILTPKTRAEGIRQPVYYWRPSIGVSGLAFYSGKEFPLWQGKLLVTGLGTRDLRLLDIEGDHVMHEEVILECEGRPYEPVVGPDGAIYLVTDDPGRLLRLTAQEERRQ
jgi:aldose sugar dehydrogenase